MEVRIGPGAKSRHAANMTAMPLVPLSMPKFGRISPAKARHIFRSEIWMAQPVSVLVDGDNISGKHAGRILSVAAQHGEPVVVRVYADAQRPSDWHGAIGYRMLHAGTGKNAADILLALDAMELVLSRDMRCFVIASSDGDFTHLATRLREHGAKVIGIGEAKAPGAFRACCSDFVEIGATRHMCLVPKSAAICTALDLKIRTMIATHSKKGAGMRIAELAPKMHSQHGVQISTHPERSWRAYLIARPSLYELDPRGPEAMVRFRPDGFTLAA
jgi:uncharacterized LabA/DUF88 family protein